MRPVEGGQGRARSAEVRRGQRGGGPRARLPVILAQRTIERTVDGVAGVPRKEEQKVAEVVVEVEEVMEVRDVVEVGEASSGQDDRAVELGTHWLHWLSRLLLLERLGKGV